MQRWVALVAAYDKSNLTMRAFAALHEVNAHSLSWWRRRLLATPPAFVELALPAVQAPPRPQPWAAASPPARVVRLELTRLGVTVAVPVGTDLTWLRDVVGALA